VGLWALLLLPLMLLVVLLLPLLCGASLMPQPKEQTNSRQWLASSVMTRLDTKSSHAEAQPKGLRQSLACAAPSESMRDMHWWPEAAVDQELTQVAT
jgi:hypothetical protein